MKKVSFPAFHDFMDYYTIIINGGGSFSGEELVELYEKYEDAQSVTQLLAEAKELGEIIKKEDWEIDRDTLDFIMRNHGKNKMKNWIQCVIEGLEQNKNLR